MEKLYFIIYITSLLAYITHGGPTKITTELEPEDEFFGANFLDADPASSELSEKYKQELLNQKFEQEREMLRQTTEDLQVEVKTEKISEVSPNTSTIQNAETSSVIFNKDETNSYVSSTTTDFPTTTTTKKPRSSGMLSRIIDDIFQIPITVIQSVARLLRNPFSQRKTTE